MFVSMLNPIVEMALSYGYLIGFNFDLEEVECGSIRTWWADFRFRLRSRSQVNY